MPTREELVLKAELTRELAKNDSILQSKNIVQQLDKLLAEYDSAVAAKDDAAAKEIATNIINLSQDAEKIVAARTPPIKKSKTDGMWPVVGVTVLILVLVGLAVLLSAYSYNAGVARISTIDGTRPILVMAAIVSTITFGGALLIGSLFSSEGTFADRFRYSREIFLVFAGIFGTVIGFYFGAGDSKGTLLGVDATSDMDSGNVVAYAVGGTPPYNITVVYGPNSQSKTIESKDGWARFSFNKTTDNIMPLRISAIDSRGINGTKALEFDKNTLSTKGWVLPPTSSETTTVSSSQ